MNGHPFFAVVSDIERCEVYAKFASRKIIMISASYSFQERVISRAEFCGGHFFRLKGGRVCRAALLTVFFVFEEFARALFCVIIGKIHRDLRNAIPNLSPPYKRFE